MTLPEADQQLSEAIAGEDLDRVTEALRLRSAALETAPEEEWARSFAQGPFFAEGIRRIKFRLNRDHIRLALIRQGLLSGAQPHNPHIDLRG